MRFFHSIDAIPELAEVPAAERRDLWRRCIGRATSGPLGVLRFIALCLTVVAGSWVGGAVGGAPWGPVLGGLIGGAVGGLIYGRLVLRRARREVAADLSGSTSDGHDETTYSVGDRVVLEGHWEFADGIVGTIVEPLNVVVELSEPGEWRGCRRVHPGRNGLITSYCVSFDEPHDDGSGDGPYRGAVIDDASLRPLLWTRRPPEVQEIHALGG